MIERIVQMTSMKDEQLPMLNSILDEICIKAMTIKVTSIQPTTENIREGELVIYDDGAGTKEIYVITGKKNLGKVTLT